MAGRIEAEIAVGALSSREVEDQLDKIAGEVVDYARSIAPVFGDRPPHRGEPASGDVGEYRDSINAISLGRGHRRVQTEDAKALWIEMGTTHMPEYAVFAKTAEHFGGTAPEIGDIGVQHAQSILRDELTTLSELHAAGASDAAIAVQRSRVRRARQSRTSAFAVSRASSRRGRRRR